MARDVPSPIDLRRVQDALEWEARVLVTCDRTNVPSRKIIEANGGVMEDETMVEDGNPPKQRFWIEIA